LAQLPACWRRPTRPQRSEGGLLRVYTLLIGGMGIGAMKFWQKGDGSGRAGRRVQDVRLLNKRPTRRRLEVCPALGWPPRERSRLPHHHRSTLSSFTYCLCTYRNPQLIGCFPHHEPAITPTFPLCAFGHTLQVRCFAITSWPRQRPGPASRESSAKLPRFRYSSLPLLS